LAKYVAKRLTSQKSCIELGCHSGALLSMIKNNCKDKPKLIGIDPDREAIELGRKRFKDIHFVNGNNSDMVDGVIPLNAKYDVLLLSDICLLLNPEALNRVFAFAEDKVKYIVIMDDIINMFGDFTALRRVYFLHPYKKMLEENGFKIIDKVFPPKPNWANSGILTAKREG
jgi:tRNA A58 N-methylase Trm61